LSSESVSDAPLLADLESIRQEGGWKSLRMVERYATVSAEHRAQAMKKLK
jgi:hypothetical protein